MDRGRYFNFGTCNYSAKVTSRSHLFTTTPYSFLVNWFNLCWFLVAPWNLSSAYHWGFSVKTGKTCRMLIHIYISSSARSSVSSNCYLVGFFPNTAGLLEVGNSMGFSGCSSRELVIVIHQSCHRQGQLCLYMLKLMWLTHLDFCTECYIFSELLALIFLPLDIDKCGQESFSATVGAIKSAYFWSSNHWNRQIFCCTCVFPLFWGKNETFVCEACVLKRTISHFHCSIEAFHHCRMGLLFFYRPRFVHGVQLRNKCSQRRYATV